MRSICKFNSIYSRHERIFYRCAKYRYVGETYRSYVHAHFLPHSESVRGADPLSPCARTRGANRISWNETIHVINNDRTGPRAVPYSTISFRFPCSPIGKKGERERETRPRHCSEPIKFNRRYFAGNTDRASGCSRMYRCK